MSNHALSVGDGNGNAGKEIIKATSKIFCGLVLLLGLVVTICIGQQSQIATDADKYYSPDDLRKLVEALAQVEPVPFAKVLPQKFSTFGYWSFQDPAGPPLPGIHCN